MNGDLLNKVKQIDDIEEIGIEVREMCDKMQQKINHLNETSFKDIVAKFCEDVHSILEVINRVNGDLDNRSAKEVEGIKDEMLSQFDKASNIERELDRMYTKETFMRQFVDNPPEVVTPPLVDQVQTKKSQSTVQSQFDKLKKITTQGFVPENTKNENSSKPAPMNKHALRMHQYSLNLGKFGKFVSSPMNSTYASKNNSIVLEKGLNEIEHKNYRNISWTKKPLSKAPSTNILQQPKPSNNENSARGSSDYKQKPVKAASEAFVDVISYFKKIWNPNVFEKRNSVFASSSSDMGIMYNEPLFKDADEMQKFFNEASDTKLSSKLLWKYIFHLQENLLSNKEKYNRLREEAEHKDKLIHELAAKLEKFNTDAEIKHIDNLILANNPKKLIENIKKAQLTNKTGTTGPARKLEIITTDDIYDNDAKYDTMKKSYNNTPSNGANITTKKFLAGLETCSTIKSPLADVSINKTFEQINAELHQMNTSIRIEQEAMFAPLSQGYSLNISIGDEDLIFSSQQNLRAYLANIHETLKAMKENSIIMQSENNKLKEFVKLLRNKVASLERERENFLVPELSTNHAKNDEYKCQPKSFGNENLKSTRPVFSASPKYGSTIKAQYGYNIKYVK